MKSTHSDRLERWLGSETTNLLSVVNRGFHGRKPIPICGVPAGIGVSGDGDFVGNMNLGAEACIKQYQEDRARARLRYARHRKQFGGWATDTALQAAVRQRLPFLKSTATSVAGGFGSLWRQGTNPAAGAAASAAPGGTVPTSASTGALPFVNAPTSEWRYLRADTMQSLNATASIVLLYDRIFAVAKTMNSTATEAVTGVPTRYQNTAAGAEDSADNFLFMEVGTILPNTAHDWTVCTYTNQAGTATKTLPLANGVPAAAAGRLDMPTTTWFCPLAAGDTGIKALTQMQCSALVATGAVDFVIGHQVAWIPTVAQNFQHIDERILTAPHFTRLYDNACLAFLAVTNTGSSITAAGYVEFGI